MSVQEAISAVMMRIATVSEAPMAVRRIDDRFASLTGDTLASVSSMGTVGSSSAAVQPRLVTRSAMSGTPGTASGVWVDRIPNARGLALAPQIQAAADRYGLEPAFLAAVFWTESSYTPDVVSRTGAIGLGQLMPETAEWLGVNPWDPAQNIDGSARFYRFLLDRNQGDLRLAIASYAAGPGAVKRAGGVPDQFTADYIEKLLGRTDYLAGRRASPP